MNGQTVNEKLTASYIFLKYGGSTILERLYTEHCMFEGICVVLAFATHI